MCESGGRCVQTLITMLFIDLCTFSPLQFLFSVLFTDPSSCGLDHFVSPPARLFCVLSIFRRKKKRTHRLFFVLFLRGLGPFPFVLVPSFDLRRPFRFVARPKCHESGFLVGRAASHQHHAPLCWFNLHLHHCKR